MSKLTIVMNLGNFSSLVALGPTRELVDTFRPEVSWCALRPADKPVTPPPEAGDPLAAYKARRKRARDRWAEAEFKRDCERLGLDPAVTPESVSPRAANLGLQFVADAGGDVQGYVDAALHRAFVAREPVAETGDILDLIESSGCDAAGFDVFANDEGEARLDVVENELAEAGIYAGPAWLLDGEAFIGRQHMPLMSWMLGGRVGTPPV